MYTFSFIVGNISPKSVKCIHSATKKNNNSCLTSNIPTLQIRNCAPRPSPRHPVPRTLWGCAHKGDSGLGTSRVSVGWALQKLYGAESGVLQPHYHQKSSSSSWLLSFSLIVNVTILFQEPSSSSSPSSWSSSLGLRG